MKILLGIYAVLAVTWGGTGDAAAAQSKSVDSLKPLARLVGGDWVGSNASPASGGINVLVTYEWGVANRLLKSRSYIVQGAKRTLVYESVFAWHPGRKQVRCQSFGARGDYFDGVVEQKGDELEFNFEAFGEGETTTYRQRFRFPSENEYVWTLWRRNGSDWQKLTETALRRKPAKV